MSDVLFSIAALTNREAAFSPVARKIGFSSPGDIERFIYHVYGKEVRDFQPAELLRGAMFVLAPGELADINTARARLRGVFGQIRGDTASSIYAIRPDVDGGLTVSYSPSQSDRSAMVGGGWPPNIAQQMSKHLGACVVWGMGVKTKVYIAGDIYLEIGDVIEGLADGIPSDFDARSWDDGRIAIDFARRELGDRSAEGIWHTPDEHVLQPRPELLIRKKFGRYLRFRLAGYMDHFEEAEVENEGRADISLYLVDNRLVIIELKWMGRSLIAKKVGASEADIKAALKSKAAGWFTTFSESDALTGVKQLVSYYDSGKYRKAYLAIFNCEQSAASVVSGYIVPSPTDLAGRDAENFRIVKACTDPRTASTRAK